MQTWIEKQKFVDCFKYGMKKEKLYGFSSPSDENEFSNGTCEICGSHLAGTRYTVTGSPIDPHAEIFEYVICPDCLYFGEYGQLDDMSELDIAGSMESWETVQADIKAFITDNIDSWYCDAVAYFEPEHEEPDATPCMDLTVATDMTGSTWNYQTGDNSYTGGAYSLPIWAVVYITESSTVDDLHSDIIGQFEESFFN